MIKVAGHWEDEGWIPTKSEIWLWNLLLRDFGILDWYMCPITNIKNIEEKVHLHEKETFKDILAETHDLQHVYFEPYNPVQQPERGIDLRDFQHPKDVLYIFGSAHYNPVMLGNKKDEDSIVQVPTIHNRGVLWPHQCLAVCLYDRLLKGWEGK